MLIPGVVVSLILLGVIIRFALSPRTDRLVKRAALIALGAIGLAILVCMIMALTAPEAVVEEEVFAGLPLAEPVAAGISPNRVYLLILGSVMLALIGFIVFLALREQAKTAGRKLWKKMNRKTGSKKKPRQLTAAKKTAKK
jgi:multisubunit Na+/H+ antiporter MnhB subunit